MHIISAFVVLVFVALAIRSRAHSDVLCLRLTAPREFEVVIFSMDGDIRIMADDVINLGMSSGTDVVPGHTVHDIAADGMNPWEWRMPKFHFKSRPSTVPFLFLPIWILVTGIVCLNGVAAFFHFQKQKDTD